MTALLDIEGLTKAFPGVLANDDVSFSIGPGEIHALLGENGAGKSTLVKMIYGVLGADSGTMHLEGEAYHPSRPSDARSKGIGMVFQHFSLFEALSALDNITLGMEKALVGPDLRDRIVDVSAEYGLPVDPDRLVGTLSVGERQRIEIVRCLLQYPRLIIMDEPTSVLTLQEVEILFKTLKRLASEGCSILYISHKLDEIRELCDKATVLRQGRVVGECTPADETSRSLAEMMIGKTLKDPQRAATETGDVRLRIAGLTLPSDEHFGVDLDDISFDVRAGEIFGLAGVAGNGQSELMEALIGEKLAHPAEAILVDNMPLGQAGPHERRRAGMSFAPEERLGHGAVPDMSLWENAVLSGRARKGLAQGGFIRAGRAAEFSEHIVKQYDVRTAGITHMARSLSGGNLQKFVIGREILQDPVVLIIDQPTWGVDAGAASAIHQALIDLAAKGTAILVISQDLDELMVISSRLAVISHGRVSEAMAIEDASVEEIGLLMGGREMETANA